MLFFYPLRFLDISAAHHRMEAIVSVLQPLDGFIRGRYFCCADVLAHLVGRAHLFRFNHLLVRLRDLQETWWAEPCWPVRVKVALKRCAFTDNDDIFVLLKRWTGVRLSRPVPTIWLCPTPCLWQELKITSKTTGQMLEEVLMRCESETVDAQSVLNACSWF